MYSVSPSSTTATVTVPIMRTTLNGRGSNFFSPNNIMHGLLQLITLSFLPNTIFLTTGCESGLVIGLGVGTVVAYLLGMGTTAALMMCYHLVTRSPGVYASAPALPHNRSA